MAGIEIFKAIDEALSPDDLLDLLSKFYATFGFAAVCYVLPSFGDPDHFQLYERGMPAEWMARYMEKDFGLIDPIPETTIRTGEVSTLKAVLEKVSVTPKLRAYLDEFYRSGVTDGLAMPTHGPHHARGFFGLAQISDDDLASVDRSLMHAVAQHAHWKMDQIGSDAGTAVAHLSPREQEILRWIAAGKSNPDIATILDISQPTVATHMKRLFAKLGVNDRVSAALAGYKLGLVNN